MSKLDDKITLLENQLGDIESELEDLYDKRYRRGKKKREKQHRKKMASDPIYRTVQACLKSLEKAMCGGSAEDEGPIFKGLSSILEKE